VESNTIGAIMKSESGRVSRVVRVGESIADAIEQAANGEQIFLASGTHALDRPVKIQDKRDIEIIGAGRTESRIRVSPDLEPPEGQQDAIAFEIGSNVKRLTISSISAFVVDRPSDKRLQFIGSRGGTDLVSDVIISHLHVQGFSVGISLATTPRHDIRDVAIQHCHVTECHGIPDGPNIAPGSGYGIHLRNVQGGEIEGCRIEDCDRHSIYVSEGQGPVYVSGNLILYHDFHGRNARTWNAALQVARTQDVSVERNLVLDSFSDAIGVHHDDRTGEFDPTNTALIGNQAIGYHHAGLWLALDEGVSHECNRYVPNMAPSDRRSASRRRPISWAKEPWDTSSPIDYRGSLKRETEPEFWTEHNGGIAKLEGGVLVDSAGWEIAFVPDALGLADDGPWLYVSSGGGVERYMSGSPSEPVMPGYLGRLLWPTVVKNRIYGVLPDGSAVSYPLSRQFYPRQSVEYIRDPGVGLPVRWLGSWGDSLFLFNGISIQEIIP